MFLFCLASDPKNHQSVTPKSDYDGKKAELGDRIKHMIEERQMKIEEIKRSAELSCKSAARHIADSERVFDILLQSVKRSLTDLTDAINKKHKQTQKQADRFIEELEQEISELTKESKKIEQLSSTTDYVELLQMFPSLSAAPSANNWTELTVTPPSYGRDMRTIVKHLEEDICKENEKLIAKVKLNRAREFAKDVTLDAETANPYLVLSDDGKQVYCGDLKQKLTDGPERFNAACNVLGKQSVSSGRFYFEVQVEGMSSWDLGVVKESIQRKGSTAASPENGYWTICLRDSHRLKAYAVHLDVKCLPKKVGVFVDYEKGSVCFYDVDSTNLIHRVTDCSFSERLYPFFSPGRHYGSKNFTPMIIYAVNYND